MKINRRILYHGSNAYFKTPDLSKSKENIDFGKGFYATRDDIMAKKWVAGKPGDALINKYTVDLSDLKIYKFTPNFEWLAFVCLNRKYPGYEKITSINIKQYEKYDILIGPVADDKMYSSIKAFFQGQLTAQETVDNLTLIGFSYQYVFKTQKAIDKLNYIETIKLTKKEKSLYYDIATTERKTAAKQAEKVLFKKNIEKNFELINSIKGPNDEKNSIEFKKGDFENDDRDEI